MPPRTVTVEDLGVSSLDEIEGDFPTDGVEVTIYHKIFHYRTAAPSDDGSFVGQAFAKRGDVVRLYDPEDFKRGVAAGAFYHPDQTPEPEQGVGPGDETADPELVEFVRDHNVDDVIERAGDDEDTARLLLAAEQSYAVTAGRDPRKGVVAGLQAIIDTAEGGGSTPSV